MNTLGKRIGSLCLAFGLAVSLFSCSAEVPKETTGSEETAAATTAGETAAETTAGTQASASETELPETGYQIPSVESDGTTVTISEEVLLDKLKGAWLGKCIGVSWASETEFVAKGTILSESKIPTYQLGYLEACYSQDDLYAMLPFFLAMSDNGVNCDMQTYMEYFGNTDFALWHANKVARQNIQNGIAYPLTGSYINNFHYNDIDWQIDCDFIGINLPGLMYVSAKQSFDIGQIVGYGDGVYGGSFVCAMHSAAYTAGTIEEVVRSAYDVLADNTTFKQLIGDVLDCYDKGYTWQQTWQMLQSRWASTDTCPECTGAANIDAKLNSGYVAIALLWGNENFEDTLKIAMRCGQDSDCNASTAGSVLGNFIGASAISDSYYTGVTNKGVAYDVFTRRGKTFYGTTYNFYDIVELSSELLLKTLPETGAVKSGDDWIIPVDSTARQVPYQQK